MGWGVERGEEGGCIYLRFLTLGFSILVDSFMFYIPLSSWQKQPQHNNPPSLLKWQCPPSKPKYPRLRHRFLPSKPKSPITLQRWQPSSTYQLLSLSSKRSFRSLPRTGSLHTEEIQIWKPGSLGPFGVCVDHFFVELD